MSSPAVVHPTGLEGDGDLQFLMNGGDLLKVRSGSWKKTRYYKLQEDCKTMWHESKKTLKSKQTCESQKGCAQGCVSQPFLCSCTRVLQWPILCFVCLYECWWMSLTEVITALPSSNPFLRINGVKWMHKTKIKLHIICTGSITLMSVTVKWSCFILKLFYL